MSQFDDPSSVRVGRCESIEETMIGEDRVRDLEQSAAVLSKFHVLVDFFIFAYCLRFVGRQLCWQCFL